MGSIVVVKPTPFRRPWTSEEPHDATGAELIEAYQATLQSEKSKKTVLESLRRAADVIGATDPRAVPWHTLQLETFGAIRTALARSYAPATANLTLSALKGLLHVAFVKGKITERQFAGLKYIKRVHGSRVEKGRALTFDDERRLQSVVRQLSGYRNVMLSTAITISIGAGLRREELCKLARGAYKADERALHVIGKGNKERVLWVDDDMAAALDEWLPVRERLHLSHGELFCAPVRPDSVLSVWAWWDAMRSAAETAKVTFSGPHDFRRTFATRLLDAGYGLEQVQTLMGHENIETTGRYDKRELDALRVKRLATRVCAPVSA